MLPSSSRKTLMILFIPLHSIAPFLLTIGDISKRQMHLPSRHSVKKLNTSHCSLKKQLSFTDASIEWQYRRTRNSCARKSAFCTKAYKLLKSKINSDMMEKNTLENYCFVKDSHSIIIHSSRNSEHKRNNGKLDEVNK